MMPVRSICRVDSVSLVASADGHRLLCSGVFCSHQGRSGRGQGRRDSHQVS